MNSVSTRATTWRERITITVFLGLVWLPLATACWRGFSPAVEGELRAAAPAPTLGVRFPAEAEAWFDDRFGLRKALVSLYGVASYSLFGMSPTPRVIVGRDGWLFYASSASTPPRDRLMSQHRGLRTLSPAELARIVAALEQDRIWLAAHGIGYLFVVAPDKHSIYRDMLPARFTSLSPSTPWDQIREELAGRADLRFVDLRPALLAAREHERVYAKTDTHWNELGAAIATREVLSALRTSFPSVSPLEVPPVIAWEERPAMALARMMAVEPLLHESSPHLAASVPVRSRAGDRERLLADPALAAHRAALTGGVLAVTETDDESLPRAVVVQDSFGELLMPFLAEHFRRVVFVHRVTGARALEALIEVEEPDVLIDEIAERMLVGLAHRSRGRFTDP